jgi:hypothetical protein
MINEIYWKFEICWKAHCLQWEIGWPSGKMNHP